VQTNPAVEQNRNIK